MSNTKTEIPTESSPTDTVDKVAELVESDTSHSDEDEATEKDTARAVTDPNTEEAILLSQLAQNKKWILKSHPADGKFNAERDMELVDDIIDLEKVAADEVVIRVDILAVDPFIRTMIDEGDAGTIKVNEPIRAMGVGTVIKGNSDTFDKGAVVVGLLTASKFAVVKSDILQEKITFAKPSSALGLLGTIGETAYIGTFIAPTKKPQKGETVVVSAAAGAVGIVVCQMAKFCGARVIGIVGDKEKKQFLLTKLKLDGAIDCSDTEKSLCQQLEEICKDGIDFFFDSVGGDVLDEVLNHINTKARVVVCGATSQYDKKGPIQGPSNYLRLAEKSATLCGFNTMDFPEYSSLGFNAATSYLGWKYMRDNIIFPELICYGLETFAVSIEKIVLDQHCGRLLVQVSDQFENTDAHAEKRVADKSKNGEEAKAEAEAPEQKHNTIGETASENADESLIDLKKDKKESFEEANEA